MKIMENYIVKFRKNQEIKQKMKNNETNSLFISNVVFSQEKWI